MASLFCRNAVGVVRRTSLLTIVRASSGPPVVEPHKGKVGKYVMSTKA